MQFYQINHKGLLALLFFITVCASNTTLARDISLEQRAASEAREAYNRAKVRAQALDKQIALQTKRVNEAQAKLDALQAEQSDTRKVVEIRKKDLDRKVEQLNAVWEERTR